MTVSENEHLTNEYLRDHQLLVRLLEEVITLLQKGNLKRASQVAEVLDRLAGPHIEFEATVLYPAAKLFHDDSLEHKLLVEHRNAKEGLRRLLAEKSIRWRKPAFRRKVILALRAGLKHAENCNLLVNHLEHLTFQQKQVALTKLHNLKKRGRRWTELPG